MSKKKFYAVAVGRKQGVYETWDETKEQVDGYKGAKYKGFTTREEAEEFAYGKKVEVKKETLEEPKVETEKVKEKKKETTEKKEAKKQENIPTEVKKGSISTDAACSGNPGDMEYRYIWTDTGETIYHSEIMFGTNNLGEFLALTEAVRYVNENDLDVPIYTDSKTAMAWVRDKQAKTTFDISKDPLLESKIKEALNYLKTNPKMPDILKWDTKQYGDIKADFGRK